MKKLPALNASSSQKLNSDTDFTNWDAEHIKSTIAALKSKAEAFNCKLRISSSEVTLTNRQGDFFSAVFDDYYDIETVEFNMSGSAVRGSLAELDEVTEKAARKLDALNELKQAWRDVSQWLELLAYAKKNNINASRRNLNCGASINFDEVIGYNGNKVLKLAGGDEIVLTGMSGMDVGTNRKKLPLTSDTMTEHYTEDFVQTGVGKKKYIVTREVTKYDRSDRRHPGFVAKIVGVSLASSRRLNSSVDVDYDYAGEELEDGYFEGSVAGTATGLSQKYANAQNWQFSNDVAAYVSTAADIVSATQHNDNFEVEISAEDEDEFEDTVAEVIEFLKTLS